MILLARHGETDYNAPPRRVQGRLDPPLNARGLEQAAALAKEAARHPIEALWSSDQRRALETAAIVGAEIGLEARVDERLAEADWGDWQDRLAEVSSVRSMPGTTHKWHLESPFDGRARRAVTGF